MTYVTGYGRKVRDEDAARRTSSLAALAVTLALLVVGLYLVDTLRTLAELQDCALSGRIACDTASW